MDRVQAEKRVSYRFIYRGKKEKDASKAILNIYRQPYFTLKA